jgi:hypothetical protein
MTNRLQLSNHRPSNNNTCIPSSEVGSETAAPDYYEACFSDRAEPLGGEEALSVDHLTHNFHGNDAWEVLLTTGGPAVRLIIQVDEWSEPVNATFEYQDWFQPWAAPKSQDGQRLLAWVNEHFYFGCDYCEQQRRR